MSVAEMPSRTWEEQPLGQYHPQAQGLFAIYLRDHRTTILTIHHRAQAHLAAGALRQVTLIRPRRVLPPARMPNTVLAETLDLIAHALRDDRSIAAAAAENERAPDPVLVAYPGSLPGPDEVAAQLQPRDPARGIGFITLEAAQTSLRVGYADPATQQCVYTSVDSAQVARQQRQASLDTTTIDTSTMYGSGGVPLL